MFWKKKEESNSKETATSKKEDNSIDKSSSDYIERLLEASSSPKIPQQQQSQQKASKGQGIKETVRGDDILPCDHFQYEIKKNCGRLARFNRVLMSDSDANVDCDRLNDLLFECRKYTEDSTRNINSLVKLREYENELVIRRIQTIRENNVWELRKEPPSDWNAELPDWAKERVKESYWYKFKDSKA